MLFLRALEREEKGGHAVFILFRIDATQGDTLSEGEDVKTGFDYLTNRTDCMDINMWS